MNYEKHIMADGGQIGFGVTGEDSRSFYASGAHVGMTFGGQYQIEIEILDGSPCLSTLDAELQSVLDTYLEIRGETPMLISMGAVGALNVVTLTFPDQNTCDAMVRKAQAILSK